MSYTAARMETSAGLTQAANSLSFGLLEAAARPVRAARIIPILNKTSANRILSNYAAEPIDHPRVDYSFSKGEYKKTRASGVERAGGSDFRPSTARNFRCLAPARASRIDRN